MVAEPAKACTRPCQLEVMLVLATGIRLSIIACTFQCMHSCSICCTPSFAMILYGQINLLLPADCIGYNVVQMHLCIARGCLADTYMDSGKT